MSSLPTSSLSRLGLSAVMSLLVLFLCLSWMESDGLVVAQQENGRFMTPPFSLDLLSDDVDKTLNVAWGDMDGDGDLDVLVGNLRQPDKIFRNDGNGKFSLLPNALGNDVSATRSVAWGDMDGDGDLDILIGAEQQANRIYRNNGNGNFGLLPGVLGSDADATQSVAWGDMDGDGDLDVLVGNNGHNKVYKNNGTESFSLVPILVGNDVDNTRSIAWGDMDGDGDLDVLAGNLDGQNKVYENESGGKFASEGIELGGELDKDPTTSVAWGDMDGDGDLDALVGNTYLEECACDSGNKVYENEGAGQFSAEPGVFADNQDFTTSVAWGDMDGDGDLDVLVGNSNEANKVYKNEGAGQFASEAIILATDLDFTTTIAWGDMDGDGDLDILAGNWDEPNKIYKNDNGASFALLTDAFSSEAERTMSIAWGDMDGDGDLDILEGNWGTSNKIYRNESAGEFVLQVGSLGSETGQTTSIAWGDMDGDHYLDVLVGNDGQANKISHNERGNGFLTLPEDLGTVQEGTESIAWGDMDGDGDLDVLVGNIYLEECACDGKNKLYRNDGAGGFKLVNTAFNGDEDDTRSIAWGDMDEDGDLDILVGNLDQPNKIYENNGSGVFNLVTNALGSDADRTMSVAWGDMDGDGDLDVLAGNDRQLNKIYRNDGEGVFTTLPNALGSDADLTTSVAWGDMDGDGDLDVLVGNTWWDGCNCDGRNKLYRNDGQGIFVALDNVLSSATDKTTSVAWGDMDGDGDLDILVGNDGQANKIYENRRHRVVAQAGLQSIYPVVIEPHMADFYAQADYIDQREIPITYRLFSQSGQPAGEVALYYSLDGGGHWLTAMATADTERTNLATAPWPAATAENTHTFTWDTFASGFFGQSDNVVLRLVALPQTTTTGTTDTFAYTNQVASPIQFGAASATTFPLRIRSSQVRILDDSQQPVAEAFVYHLPAPQTVGALPISQNTGVPFKTNSEGFLQGRGVIRFGDTLFGMSPILQADNGAYTLYNTNIRPLLTTIAGAEVTQAGVQPIVVSANNPLVLFHLDISLEWDARQDDVYLSELEANLRRASELLFDWSNGQMALGEITLYHNREHWGDADIQILADNRYRPNADQGGLHDELIDDPIIEDRRYEPGQLRMGATWNRHGEAENNVGEDWARTLVHELGHYLLFMDDNYYGYNGLGQLIPVESCLGAMADPYTAVDDDGQNEFHADTDWLADCTQTASHWNNGRSDWSTLTAFYPWLNKPAGQAFYGPNRYPLATMQLNEVEPSTAASTIPNPLFALLEKEGGSYAATNQAQAYLIRADDRVMSLGGTQQGQLTARGAQPGDRLCVQDRARHDYGCKIIMADENYELEIEAQSAWQPEIVFTSIAIDNDETVTPPLVTTTVNFEVDTHMAAISELQAQLYPFSGTPIPAIRLTHIEASRYRGSFVVNQPIPAAAVHVWDGAPSWQESEPRFDVITDYALGGNPWCLFGRWGTTCNRSGKKPAPVLSTDGLASIVGRDLVFEENQFYILQAASTLPEPPDWATVVGQPYRLTKSPDAPAFEGASIQIAYLSREVPLVTEEALFVYYFDGESWQKLPTERFSGVAQTVSAPVQGGGLYVVMATITAPELEVGWNLFAYPNIDARPVGEALASLDPAEYDCGRYCYTSVYQSQGEDWLLYDQTVAMENPQFAAEVNDLQLLEPLRSYWVYATAKITPLIRPLATTRAPNQAQLSLPPATYYGWVIETADFTPKEGDLVEAWIDGSLCGSSRVMELSGQLAYVIQVEADNNGNHCGTTNRMITFTVAGVDVSSGSRWSNHRACFRPLDGVADGGCLTHQLYLPFIPMR